MTFVLKDKQYSLRFICDWQRNRNSGLASCSKAKGKLGEEHHFWGKGVGRAAVWGSPGGGRARGPAGHLWGLLEGGGDFLPPAGGCIPGMHSHWPPDSMWPQGERAPLCFCGHPDGLSGSQH